MKKIAMLLVGVLINQSTLSMEKIKRTSDAETKQKISVELFQ